MTWPGLPPAFFVEVVVRLLHRQELLKLNSEIELGKDKHMNNQEIKIAREYWIPRSLLAIADEKARAMNLSRSELLRNLVTSFLDDPQADPPPRARRGARTVVSKVQIYHPLKDVVRMRELKAEKGWTYTQIVCCAIRKAEEV